MEIPIKNIHDKARAATSILGHTKILLLGLLWNAGVVGTEL